MDAWPCMHGHACMAAGRAGRPRGQAEPREDDVRRRLDGRWAGLDDDGGAGAAETTRSIVDRKVEDEPVDIYRPGPFSPGW